MKRWAAFASGVALAWGAAREPVARADYLEVRQSADLKSATSRNADTVRKLSPGDQLELVGTAQENGYYRVRADDAAQGYVYRTLVRRHAGRNCRGAPGSRGCPGDARASH